ASGAARGRPAILEARRHNVSTSEEHIMFDGRVAVVTGSGSGIGRASALSFANAGARVAVADFDAEGGEATAAEIRDRGGEGVYVACDVTDDDSVAAMVASVVERWGQLDFAHNNAGISPHTGNT